VGRFIFPTENRYSAKTGEGIQSAGNFNSIRALLTPVPANVPYGQYIDLGGNSPNNGRSAIGFLRQVRPGAPIPLIPGAPAIPGIQNSQGLRGIVVDPQNAANFKFIRPFWRPSMQRRAGSVRAPLGSGYSVKMISLHEVLAGNPALSIPSAFAPIDNPIHVDDQNMLLELENVMH
jgi:hypothetical protein